MTAKLACACMARIGLFTAVSLSATMAYAQDQPAPAKSSDEIARELANPNNSLASLKFKNEYRWYTGDLPGADDQSNYTLLFQPVFPFSLPAPSGGGKANFFVRPAFPLVVDQPVPSATGFGGVTALGDIGFDMVYGVTEPNGLLWAFGMVGTLPTATDSDVAGKQLRLGPEGFVAQFEDWGLYGVFPSHQWNVAGWGDSYHSVSQLQAVLTFLPGGGWSYGSFPTMTYDWRSGDWTIPLHLGVSKTTQIGGLPVKLELEVNYYIVQPDAFGPRWMLSFNITPVVSNFVESWIRR